VFLKQGRVIHELDMSVAPSGLEVELRVEGASDTVLGTYGTLLSHDDHVARLRVGDESQLPLLAAALVQSGARLYAMTPHKRSLEDTFLAVMGEDQRPG
jgi:ABC-2 type transport system ATP-binding protein